MGFENPQAVYKWISGKCLPSLDNFLILSRLLNTSIEDILVIDGDIPRFRSKYREIRERLNRWYNDKIVILWYSEEKAEKEPVKKVLERKNRCQQEYVLATAILEHTPEATFVVKQRGFVLICSIEKSDRTDSVEYDTGGSN